MADNSRANQERIRELEQELQACRAQLALAHTECRYYLHALTEIMPSGVIFANVQGEIMLANPAAYKLLGGQIAASVYQPGTRATFTHPDGTPLPTADYPLIRALQQGETSHDVMMLLRSDETERMLTVSANPIRGADGSIMGAVAIFTDITERKRVEEALRDSEARFRAFSESTTEAIVLHEKGVIVEVNQTLADHLGYTPQEMLGRSVLEFYRAGITRGDDLAYDDRRPRPLCGFLTP